MIALFLFLLFFSSCSETPNTTTGFSGVQMTIPYRIVIGKTLTSLERRETALLINQTFDKIDQIYNNWNPDSEISRLNQAPAKEKLPLSQDLEHFLKETAALVSLSEGRFDPTIAPLALLWKKELKKGWIPTQEALEKAGQTTGWEHIHIEAGWFWKDFPETSLDLGGIAKGYAIDLLVEQLNQAGYPDIFVEWGGEIRASGNHPEGRPWRVLVSKWGMFDPEGGEAVSLHNGAIAASGNYIQNWTVEGETFCHIIHPLKKCPLIVKGNRVCSTAVAAPTCLLADALATAGMVCETEEEAGVWLRKVQEIYPEIRFWIYKSD